MSYFLNAKYLIYFEFDCYYLDFRPKSYSQIGISHRCRTACLDFVLDIFPTTNCYFNFIHEYKCTNIYILIAQSFFF